MKITHTWLTSITTKYMGPTNKRGSRVKATSANGNSITLSWDCGLGTDDNHDAAAVALCSKMDWPHDLVCGGSANGHGHVYVMLPKHRGLDGA